LLYDCRIVETKQDIKKFLSLPQSLYKKHELTQDKKSEHQILSGQHVLSHCFEVKGFLVEKDGDVVSRCILTLYEGDVNAYVGFFESINDIDAADCLFKKVIEEVKLSGRDKIIGPVNCSIWLGYRFKTDHFEEMYTGEPYNKSYYMDLWESAGFTVQQRYYSNKLRTPQDRDDNKKCKNRLDYVIKEGIQVRNTNKRIFMQDLSDIYSLLIRVYSNFPGFKYIDENQFVSLFKKLKYILNDKAVFLGYKNNQLAGFLVCVPNYGNIKSIFDLLKKPKEYVMLYMGADKDAYGLGGAFSELAYAFLKRHQYKCITALILEGNVSGTFYKNLVEDTCYYVLMKKKLSINTK